MFGLPAGLRNRTVLRQPNSFGLCLLSIRHNERFEEMSSVVVIN